MTGSTVHGGLDVDAADGINDIREGVCTACVINTVKSKCFPGMGGVLDANVDL